MALTYDDFFVKLECITIHKEREKEHYYLPQNQIH